MDNQRNQIKKIVKSHTGCDIDKYKDISEGDINIMDNYQMLVALANLKVEPIIKKEKVEYSLFASRHDLPKNMGAIFEGNAKFCDKGAIFEKSKHYYNMMKSLANGEEVLLYITGLTPAVTYTIQKKIENKYDGKLVCMHYNSINNSYYRMGEF